MLGPKEDRHLAIILVGLPARGKTFTAAKLTRYLRWLGHNTKHFNVGKYRRLKHGANQSADFFAADNPEGVEARNEVAALAFEDMVSWMHEGGQVGIFDATNSNKRRRNMLMKLAEGVLMIVIPLQVLANLASVVIGETGPFIKDWVTWNQVFLLVDIICCCAIIFPIVWSIRSLRETSKTDGKAARNLSKLTLFRQFYIVVIGYLYFTRIVVFALRTIAAYKYQWVSNAAEETASLAFYMVMFYMFRPVEKNEYFVLDDEEEEAAEMALREEEFEL